MTRVFAPGRIEVLGKHTDYAGGRSLLAAVDVGVTATLTEGNQAGLTISSDATQDTVQITSGSPPIGHWATYAATVWHRLQRNFGELPPSRIHLTSTLPLASGMSSSSALVVAVADALVAHYDLDSRPEFAENIDSVEARAEYYGCIENGQSFRSLAGTAGVGTFGGSEDHTAIMCCKQDTLSQYSFCPIRHEVDVAFDPGLSFVVAVSGVLAEKTGATQDDYNRASLATRELLQIWREKAGPEATSLAEALRSDPSAVDYLSAWAHSDYLERRLRQFYAESEVIIPAAVSALTEGNFEQLRELVRESQQLAETHLSNQIPETSVLAADAVQLGAIAASSFGAGFGGSVWALVPTSDAPEFATIWLADYLKRFRKHKGKARTLITRPGPSTHLLN